VAASKNDLCRQYGARIKHLRATLGLTQVRLAELLGVSFASVNRWENGQSKPGNLAWRRILAAERRGLDGFNDDGVVAVQVESPEPTPEPLPKLDFSSDPDVVRAVAEGERLTYGYLFNPAFAAEISLIDPLPHQRIAVYSAMLPEPRLRFLLADDAGAGKTIMTGLYIREMLTRQLLRRIIIVPPAGLVGNWQNELKKLFNLDFRIVSGPDARSDNPFVGPLSDRLIVSIDTLRSERVFARLRQSGVAPYELAVFDEAHKLTVSRDPDLRIRKTNRYQLAEALAGVPGLDPEWRLSWSCRHLLLLTATPHMGKEYPYYGLWRLLEPEVLSTKEAFDAYPAQARQRHFLRRTKEEMVRFDGTPIFPTRISDTLSYDLSQGETSEQALYDATSDYIRFHYNKARLLNRSAARLAMSVFQRRLASSTWALKCSLERRLQRLDQWIEDLASGKITEQELQARQQKMQLELSLDATTGDEEEPEADGLEQNEAEQRSAMNANTARNLTDLVLEQRQVKDLLTLATEVYQRGEESKFEKLREQINGRPGEKILIFTEHRDTLDFLIRRLEGLGFTGQLASIHGAMDWKDRLKEVEFFRTPIEKGGAHYMVCTDAAAEGINLQFCWLMVNYDIPWNPARLEQRMGRIHRYNQNHDPVVIVNLVAGKTREGRVYKTILEKLERIRKELGSDKVFDVIGRLFEEVSISDYMARALQSDRDAEEASHKLGGILTPEQITALRERERTLFGEGGDVKSKLPAQRAKLEREQMRRLLPGYVRSFLERAAPLLRFGLDGDLDGIFTIECGHSQEAQALRIAMEAYPEEKRGRFTVHRPSEEDKAIFLYPGEPFFDRLRELVAARFGRAALAGAVLVDPYASQPYLFSLAAVSAVRRADDSIAQFAGQEILEQRLIGIKQDGAGAIEECPVEQMLVLKGTASAASWAAVPAAAPRFGGPDSNAIDQADAFALENGARPMAERRRAALLESLPERERFIRSGFDYEESDLLARAALLSGKARGGDARARAELNEVRQRQRELEARREEALKILRREPELVAPDKVEFIANALVVPTSDEEDRKRHDAEVEKIAMEVARQYEIARGAQIFDVHTPELARAARLNDNPGFDLLAVKDGERRPIEVKGRREIGDIELTENEWSQACNLRDKYWLYVVFDCASAHPRLLRVRDPFRKLLASPKGGVIVDETAIFAAADN